MSATLIDCTSSSPTPGHWNTVSVTSEKPMIQPSCKPDDGDDRDQRVLERVAEIDRPLGDAAGAGELHVVAAQHLQHLGAHQAHDQRHLEQAERDRRQDQRAQAADGQEAGAPPAELDHRAAPEARQPAEAAPRRSGSAGCRAGRSAATRPARLTTMNSRETQELRRMPVIDAHRHADQQRQHRGGDRQLQRRRQPLADQAGDRLGQPVADRRNCRAAPPRCSARTGR